MKPAQCPSKAEKVFELVTTFWPIPEDTHLSPEDAVRGGRMVADNLFGAMAEAGLAVRDGFALLVCKHGDELGGCAPFTPDNADTCDLEMQRLFLSGKLEPIGVMVGILDRERKVLRHHCQGFEPSERNNALLAVAHARLARGDLKTPVYN